jgi:hypothetical protein
MSKDAKAPVTRVTLKDANSLPEPLQQQIGEVVKVEPTPRDRAVPPDWPGRLMTVKFGPQVVCTPASNLTIVT